MRRLALATLLISTPAFASYSNTRAAMFEDDHLLSLGAGMSSPSETSALDENPAGLANNRTFKLVGELASGNDQFSPVGYGGGFIAGNGFVGGGIVVRGSNGTANGVASALSELDFGVAADFTSANLAFGFSGGYHILGMGPVVGTFGTSNWTLNSGLIFLPRSQTRFGITLFDLPDSVPAFGAGVAYDPNNWSTLVVDGTYNRNSQTAILKPALGIHLSSFQLEGGYGFRVQGTGSGWTNTGLAMGVGFAVSHKASLQIYYNQMALYYADLTITLF